jgi:hypothetical protein
VSRNYKFHSPKGLYFISFAVVGWLAVFTRNEFKELVIESLEFCQKKQGNGNTCLVAYDKACIFNFQKY